MRAVLDRREKGLKVVLTSVMNRVIMMILDEGDGGQILDPKGRGARSRVTLHHVIASGRSLRSKPSWCPPSSGLQLFSKSHLSRYLNWVRPICGIWLVQHVMS